MGEVYRAVGEEPVRLIITERSGKEIPNPQPSPRLRPAGNSQIPNEILGICQAIVVPAKRGRHLAIPYGPVFSDGFLQGEERFQVSSLRPVRPRPGGQGYGRQAGFRFLLEELKRVAREKNCAFIRMSPFWPKGDLKDFGFRPSPLHLLAEHIWYLPLRGSTKHQAPNTKQAPSTKITEEEIFQNMRATTRNLIRRAEREGVTVSASDDPIRDLPHFLALHEETRRRHGFTPYTDGFFRAQVEIFAPRKQCALYLARYQNEVIAASIHMIYGGETSYHHGASTAKYAKIPASYLLQWTAIRDALKRGDRVYNFWGIAPLQSSGSTKHQAPNTKHPFAGVTTFKTGFGGELLELVHCMDLPLSKRYFITWGIETMRKWRRGF